MASVVVDGVVCAGHEIIEHAIVVGVTPSSPLAGDGTGAPPTGDSQGAEHDAEAGAPIVTRAAEPDR